MASGTDETSSDTEFWRSIKFDSEHAEKEMSLETPGTSPTAVCVNQLQNTFASETSLDLSNFFGAEQPPSEVKSSSAVPHNIKEPSEPNSSQLADSSTSESFIGPILNGYGYSDLQTSTEESVPAVPDFNLNLLPSSSQVEQKNSPPASPPVGEKVDSYVRAMQLDNGTYENEPLPNSTSSSNEQPTVAGLDSQKFVASDFFSIPSEVKALIEATVMDENRLRSGAKLVKDNVRLKAITDGLFKENSAEDLSFQKNWKMFQNICLHYYHWRVAVHYGNSPSQPVQTFAKLSAPSRNYAFRIEDEIWERAYDRFRNASSGCVCRRLREAGKVLYDEVTAQQQLEPQPMSRKRKAGDNAIDMQMRIIRDGCSWLKMNPPERSMAAFERAWNIGLLQMCDEDWRDLKEFVFGTYAKAKRRKSEYVE